jgi:hypothetical protein
MGGAAAREVLVFECALSGSGQSNLPELFAWSFAMRRSQG